MKKLIAVSLLTILSGVCMADATTEIAKCATESGDAQRLMCYDDLAKQLGVDKPEAKTTTGKGKWIVQSEVSPIDDSMNVIVALEANEEISGQLGLKKKTPFLMLRCAENKTVAYITWGRFLGTDSTRVLTRVDKQKSQTKTWSLSTDNKATFAKPAIPFIKSLFNHDKLLVQTTPYGASPVMTSFDIGGLEESIKLLRKTCHW